MNTNLDETQVQVLLEITDHFVIIPEVRELRLHHICDMHETFNRDVLVSTTILAFVRLIRDEDVVRANKVGTGEPCRGVLRYVIEEDDQRVGAIDRKRLDGEVDGPRGHGGRLSSEDGLEDLARGATVEGVDGLSDVGAGVAGDVLKLRVGVVEYFVIADFVRCPVRAFGIPERRERWNVE